MSFELRLIDPMEDNQPSPLQMALIDQMEYNQPSPLQIIYPTSESDYAEIDDNYGSECNMQA